MQLLTILVDEPNVLFLDEPTNDLDVQRVTDHVQVSEPVLTVQAEDQPSWAEIVRHAEQLTRCHRGVTQRL